MGYNGNYREELTKYLLTKKEELDKLNNNNLYFLELHLSYAVLYIEDLNHLSDEELTNYIIEYLNECSNSNSDTIKEYNKLKQEIVKLKVK